MRKVLIVAALVVGLNSASSQVPGNRGQPSQTKEDQGNTSAQPYTSNVPIHVSTAKQEDNPKSEPYQWRELYAPANIPIWALTALAGWAGFMALRTLGAIKTQADLMKRQAEAMENAERARISVEGSRLGSFLSNLRRKT